MPARKKAGADEEPHRALLNLEGGNRGGLERVLQHLLGRRNPPPLASPILEMLTGLNFEIRAGRESYQLIHPLAPGRVVLLPFQDDLKTEAAILDFAVRHFPELEFYLPYIQRRALHNLSHKQNVPGLPLPPEPEYDEDGFLEQP